MWIPREPTPAEAPVEAVRRNDALGAGMKRRQLEDRRRHRRVARGLWVPADVPDNLWQRCGALRAGLPRDAVFSHYTAASLYRVTVPDEPLIHVCTMQPVEPRIGGVVAHRILTLGDGDSCWLRGLRVTTPGRTFLDLAARLDLLSLVIAGDGLAARAENGVSDLRVTVEAGVGRRGVKLARTALPLLDPASKSPMESRLRFLVVTALLGPVLVNKPVFDDAGEMFAEPDLQFADFKIAIEYEGDHHHLDEGQWRRDIKRDELYRVHGWILIKVTKMDLLVRPATVIERIRDALISRGWRRP
ncbi:hypothetical protein [Sporichthya polymorpha]|uniref:hypothetical protein n=1 Tax=Sporichthya polymorpha TaxID=35751 RepID=UPI00039AEC3B|nr:hypothetical protein [Sporichthya polymorpha]